MRWSWWWWWRFESTNSLDLLQLWESKHFYAKGWFSCCQCSEVIFFSPHPTTLREIKQVLQLNLTPGHKVFLLFISRGDLIRAQPSEILETSWRLSQKLGQGSRINTASRALRLQCWETTVPPSALKWAKSTWRIFLILSSKQTTENSCNWNHLLLAQEPVALRAPRPLPPR